MDKARSRFEPDEDGGFALWVMPVCVVDERFEEEIEAVDPLRCVRKGPVVDLVGFHPGCRERFALRTGNGVVLGAIEPQYLEPEPVPVHVVYPTTRHLAAKVRVFVDFLAQRFVGEPSWHQGWK